MQQMLKDAFISHYYELLLITHSLADGGFDHKLVLANVKREQ